jgi:hypothetical protein
MCCLVVGDKGWDPAMLTCVWSAKVISVISWHRWVVGGRRADPHRDFVVMVMAVLVDPKYCPSANL